MTRPARVGLTSVLVAVAACFAAPAVHAQSPTTGALSGTVRDAAGEPLVGARVALTPVGEDFGPAVSTTAGGAFRLPLLAPGEYALTVETAGHRPERTTIRIAPGSEVAVQVVLAVQANGAPGAAGVFPGASPGRPIGDVTPLAALRHLPLGPRSTVQEMARLSPWLNASLGAEGLPGSLTTLLLDGTAFRPASHPLAWSDPWGSTAFGLGQFGAAELALNGVDGAWPRAAGAVLGLRTGAGHDARPEGAAAGWSGDVLPGASSYEDADFDDVRLGLLLRESARGGRARLTFGGQLSRERVPHARPWPATDAARSLAGAAAEAGVLLGDPTLAGTARADAVSLFAHADWQRSERHRLEASANVATLPRVAAPIGAGASSAFAGPVLEGVDAVFGAALHSALSDDLANLARVAVTHSQRSAGELDAVGETFLAREGLAFGSGARGAETRETLFHLGSALQHHAGAHTLSGGAALTLGTYRYEHLERAEGAFFFGSADLLRSGRGAWLRTEGPEPFATWEASAISLHVEDHWRVAPDLELVAGAVVQRESLPESRVTRDDDWFRLTGLANDVVERRAVRISPRVGATWDAAGDGRWILGLAAAAHVDRYDPLLLAQWQHDAGAVRVRRVVGDVDWPEPTGGGAPLRRLTVLSDDLEPPRTARLSATLTHRAGPSTTLDFRVVTRRTESLPRRRDLNLLPLPTARDQHGRPVFGALAQEGEVLAALPGTGRRFGAYDEVVGVGADGWSEHQGASVAVEHELAGRVFLSASYALSRTRDNWFGGGWATQAPTLLEGDDDWAEGRSDYDAPHRATVGAAFEPVEGLRLSALYRYASGRPFTPGFRAGVDADGDGAFGNDPAFVDAALPGMDALLRRWSCLDDAQGGFAPRNACRGEASHAADVRAEWLGGRIAGAGASLIVELFNALDGAARPADAALYLLDPARELVTDAAARTVTVPLVVNPSFGQPLDGPAPGRLLRVGLSLTW